jgi:hypothetical protein
MTPKNADKNMNKATEVKDVMDKSDVIIKVLICDFCGPYKVLCGDGKIYQRTSDWHWKMVEE